MDRYFDEELNNLKQRLLNMCSFVEKMIEEAIEALKKRESSFIDKVFEKEEKVNLAQIEIDSKALELIALRQPAASDLRFIISVIKMNSDLERMADLAVNIAERAKELLKEPPLKPLIDLPRMATLTQNMLKNAIQSLLEKNSNLARKVCENDDEVDNLNEQIFRELITYMLSDPKNINRAIKLILIGRYLERIADLATNIAEDVYYILEGKDIRHHIEEKEKK
ncbi:MAG: phosphate transport system regulatory protein PhoU [Candidatus Omnitrophica bacterium 4484_70.2]|nr:MAG: phosphate transport system regulatory protein PhoU [Candidatus Omnitrophica bacterium 4484_70.2]